MAHGLGNSINDFVKSQTELIAPRGMVSFFIEVRVSYFCECKEKQKLIRGPF